jgi:hypothetical protein
VDPFAVTTVAEPVEARGPVFSPSGGGFAGSQTVRLSTTKPGQTIRYTLDGSLPTAGSQAYEVPIELTDTTLLRAVLLGPNASEFPEFGAQTYVALDADAASFSSDLPIVLLERHGASSIETDSNDLRTTSALFFARGANGRAALRSEAALSSRAGVRVRGQSSRSFPQKSYSLELWNAETDSDAHHPVLGFPAESDWVLVAPSEIDRSLMRTMLPMDLSRQIGAYAPRTQLVEVFLVDRQDSSSLSRTDYVGVYTLAEKIKRDPARVNVAKLGQDDTSAELISGGYMIKIDHGGEHFSAGGYGFQWVYPEPDVMRTPERAPQVDYLRDTIGEFFEALRSDDFTHPETGQHYTTYIDRGLWIDHNLINALLKNVDGLRLSAYFYKDRNGPLVAGPVWDFDRSSGTPHDDRAERANEWARGDGTEPLRQMFWGDLFEDPEFAAAYWARWDELRAGAFRTDTLLARIDAYEAQLLEARERHFDRWRDLPPTDGPAGEVVILREFLSQRVKWIDSQRR